MGLLEKIRNILATSFVYFDEVAEILAVALTAKKNVILWGPGGHAKSAMVAEVIKGLNLADDTYIMSFGEGMDEAQLWGGLDFARLDAEKVLEYHPERSFLARGTAVFEELFDAPASVLLSLKDALTAGELRKGSQRFPMKTQAIIACTNREPSEVADLGPAAAALVERFPLQLRVAWPSYTSDDYKSLFAKVPAPRLNGFTPILAEVIGKAVSEGHFVSPRTAVHARDAVIGRAAARGAAEVEKEDLGALRFVPGLEKLGESVAVEIEAAMARAKAASDLSLAEGRLNALKAEAASVESPIKALQTAKRLAVVETELAGIAVPDELVKKRDGLRQAVGQLITLARRKAEELTRI